METLSQNPSPFDSPLHHQHQQGYPQQQQHHPEGGGLGHYQAMQPSPSLGRGNPALFSPNVGGNGGGAGGGFGGQQQQQGQQGQGKPRGLW